MARKKKTRREICILGYAEETRDKVFDLADDVEIWGINMAHMFLGDRKKAARWFQMHPRDWSTGGAEPTGYWGRPVEHFEFLKAFEGPVYMSYDDPDIPNRVVYSREKVISDLGKDGKWAREYLTSTFAYIMSLAVSEKVDKIYLYGINLTAVDEYLHQRNCMEYWIGQAEGRGIEVEIPAASALCKAPLYGFTSDNPTYTMQKHANDRLQRHKENLHEQACNLMGAAAMKMEVEHWAEYLAAAAEQVQKWVGEQEFPEEVLQKLIELGNGLQGSIQQHLNERHGGFSQLFERSGAEYQKEQGMVQDNQHYLSVMGGIDARTGVLLPPRFVSPVLKGEFYKNLKGQAI